MRSLLRWSLLAISFAVQVHSTPLSTSPNYVSSRQRLPLPLAPLHEGGHPHQTINNSYIVVFKDDVSSALMQNHLNFLIMVHEANPLMGNNEMSGIKHVYDGHLKGYAGSFSDHVVDQLRRMPEVAYVERDQMVHTMDVNEQKTAPWGLARISHRPKLRFSTFSKYVYDTNGGEGVDVYVIDTGININHVEFEGRAIWGTTIPQGDVDEDGNGHGTHCAGTIASRKFGVAKAANVIAVKVLSSNGSGTMSDVVAGVVWAAQRAIAKAKEAELEYAATGKTKHKGSVANMSLGGGKAQSLDDAVDKAVALGLHFAVAAGNDNRDACLYSPAAAENALTVGASTLSDERAYFSNHGSCVDVFAPGLNILSTWTGSDIAVNVISGTSMASPHAAGLLAYLLSLYPSETFDPSIFPVSAPDLRNTFTANPLSSLSSIVQTILPGWVPLPKFLFQTVAPTPPKRPTLSPAELKSAVISLASRGLLQELPANTSNLLIFNNATGPE